LGSSGDGPPGARDPGLELQAARLFTSRGRYVRFQELGAKDMGRKNLDESHVVARAQPRELGELYFLAQGARHFWVEEPRAAHRLLAEVSVHERRARLVGAIEGPDFGGLVGEFRTAADLLGQESAHRLAQDELVL